MVSKTPESKLLQRCISSGRRMFLAVIVFAAASAGWARAQESACPFPEQKRMLVVQMFFGRNIPHHHSVTSEQWNKFLRQTVTPLFPDGFTVYDAYGQWLSPQSHTVSRDPTKVLVIATADTPEVRGKVAQVSETYRQLFHQESVGVVSLTECGAF
jgi:hypothetical protein